MEGVRVGHGGREGKEWAPEQSQVVDGDGKARVESVVMVFIIKMEADKLMMIQQWG